jgi:hypothetical protein
MHTPLHTSNLATELHSWHNSKVSEYPLLLIKIVSSEASELYGSKQTLKLKEEKTFISHWALPELCCSILNCTPESSDVWEKSEPLFSLRSQ